MGTAALPVGQRPSQLGKFFQKEQLFLRKLAIVYFPGLLLHLGRKIIAP